MASMVGAALVAANVIPKSLDLQRRRLRRVSHRKCFTGVTAVAAPPIQPANVELPTMTTPTSPIGKHWASAFCDHLERQVRAWSSRSVRGGACESESERDEVMSRSYLLAENYAPVAEMAPTSNLPVVGTIPACLNGQFLRNGPNPKFQPVGGYHWFDGDGMIHGLNIKDGKATYAARYVQTSRLLQEERYGASKFVKVADMTGVAGCCLIAIELLRRISGILDASNGVGTGNTSLVFHNNKLLALYEHDRPYIIKVLEDGDLQTISIEDYGQKLNHSFTAHPKIDPTTGEMFFFACKLVSAPYLIYRIVSKDGIIGERVPIKIPSPIMIHDFAISENYAIFMDTSVSCNLKGMAAGDFILKFDANKESRLGILPRYATNDSQIQWFKIPTCYICHAVNAWEERDEVVLICCLQESINLSPQVQFEKKTAFGIASKLHEFRMNLKTGEVKHKQLSNLSTDFPQINPEYTSRKVRYAYCAVFDDHDKIKGVAKYDLNMEPSQSNSTNRELKIGGNIVGVFHYGEGRAGEEAIFVPCKLGMELGLEDDGYLISFVHDANTGKSEVVVIDAKSMAPNPVAVVELPRRVPHGFHALFISQYSHENHEYYGECYKNCMEFLAFTLAHKMAYKANSNSVLNKVKGGESDFVVSYKFFIMLVKLWNYFSNED